MRTSKYWINRINHQNEINYGRLTTDTDKKLAQLYAETANEIVAEIMKLYDKFDKRPEDVIMNDFYKNNNYYLMLNKINKKLAELGQAEIRIMNTQLLELYQKTSETVSSNIGFTIGFDAGNQEVVNRIWCPDGKHWSNRIWKNKAVMQDRLEKGIADCVSRGLSKDKVVSSLVDAIGVDRKKAERLVRTELTYVQNQACADTYTKAGIDKYEYLAIEDTRTSEQCHNLNGKVFRFADAQIGVNFPPIHANCRCTIIPVIE